MIHALEDGETANKYVYHFSDDKKHDAGFTFTVIDDLLKFYPETNIYRLKSDNCSAQYKCRHVFFHYRLLAMKIEKTILVYYGVAGHEKGLVDAMGGFGVKTPMRRAIILFEKLFNTSQEMADYLNRDKQR